MKLSGITGKLWIAAAVALVLFTAEGLAQETRTRFQAVDVFVDSGKRPLAAYQIEFRVKDGRAKIVGIEGGEHSAFQQPPFYDPQAMQSERVIIAAFNTAASQKLPAGRTRVATIHLQLTGSRTPQFLVHLKTAGSANGRKIPAEVTVENR